MPHETPLIATIVFGLSLAFIFGTIANRLRIPLLAGYLLAGIAIGPYTPGYVADQKLAVELAEIGIILLMFGVGLHFSLKDLLSVRAIAVPGALVQITAATVLGMLMAWLLGWGLGAGIIFGLALSVASTVVLLRALQQRRLIDTERGRIAVGWLIVEDIVMIFALVLLPAIAPLLGGKVEGAAPIELGTAGILSALALTVLKISGFVAVMLVVGRRLIPWVLHLVAHTGSRELFRLAVLSIALGFAYGAAKLFGVSFALGAFFAGMILAESTLSQQAAAESLPLRDAFAVLFFVSVGMLFDPSILVRETWPVIATVLIIVIGKSLAALAIVIAFRYPLLTAFTISASLAQIGEFSFILASLGTELSLLPTEGRDLILAGALLSILLNPLAFIILDRLKPWLEQPDVPGGTQADAGEPIASEATDELPVTSLSGHTVLVGYGRVGRRIVDILGNEAQKLLVIEEKSEQVDVLRKRGIEAIAGTASEVLKAANLAGADTLLVAIPDTFESGQVVAEARRANPALRIIARCHSDAEASHLRQFGADVVVMGEDEIARAMAAPLATN